MERRDFGAATPLLARMLRDDPADAELLRFQGEVDAAPGSHFASLGCGIEKFFYAEGDEASITQNVDLGGAAECTVRVRAATNPSATPGTLRVSINGKALLFDGSPGPEPPPNVFQSYKFTGSESFVGEALTQAQLTIEARGGEVWVDDVEVITCAL